MKLVELAIACFFYDAFTRYDESLTAFQKQMPDSLDLHDARHRKELLTWLNKWQCRQFATDFHDLASREIHKWYRRFQSSLFSPERGILELTEEDFASLAPAYDELTECLASYRKRGAKSDPVRVGPAGAAKTLFALRPKALPPWDESIRGALGFDKTSASYIAFVKGTRDTLKQLQAECVTRGFDLVDLPAKLRRPISSLPKLIDEYNWVTITRQVALPDAKTLNRWADWAQTSVPGT